LIVSQFFDLLETCQGGKNILRIAILILMHEYTDLQRILIDHLSRDFDLYIHVDKKTKIDIDLIRKQNVYVFKRFKVYWGSLNQIRATILLLSQSVIIFRF